MSDGSICERREAKGGNSERQKGSALVTDITLSLCDVVLANMPAKSQANTFRFSREFRYFLEFFNRFLLMFRRQTLSIVAAIMRNLDESTDFVELLVATDKIPVRCWGIIDFR